MKFISKLLLSLSLLIFLNFSLQAQSKIDSLSSLSKDLHGKAKISCMIELSWEYFFNNDFEECILESKEAIKLAQDHKDLVGEAKALNILAIVFSHTNNEQEARTHAKKAIEVAKKAKNKKEEANALNLLGLSHDKEQDYDKALDYHFQALNIRRNTGDKLGIAKSLNNIGLIYYNRGQYVKAIDYYEEALIIKEELGDILGTGNVCSNIGNIYLNQKNTDKALEYIQKALKLFEQIDYQHGIAVTLNTYGLIYENFENYDKAIEYYKKAKEIHESIGYLAGVSNSLSNIGNAFSLNNNYEEAVKYYNKALNIRTDMEDENGIAISLHVIGIVYAKWKKYDEAIAHYEKSLEINRRKGNKREISHNLTALAQTYLNQKKYPLAISYYNESLELSLELGLLDNSKNNYQDLSLISKEMGDYQAALKYFESYSKFQDSILNEDKIEIISRLQTIYETEKKEAQIKIQESEIEKKEAENKRQRLVIAFFIMGLVMIMGLVGVILKSLQQKKKDNRIIVAEKAKSEELLLNTLPIKVVNDLKKNGKSEPESFDDVTVYFSDVVGFTNMSSQLEPKELINELNDIFTAFDDIMTKYKCERIKTIGDAYMAVCGMPEPNAKHAQNMVEASLEICDYLHKRNEVSKVSWKIRIGLNSGKVVGGIVGVRKYIYDVFGDTINTASRMESNSEPMRINIANATYELVKDQYHITKREDREIKGKGKMQMFFIDGPKN